MLIHLRKLFCASLIFFSHASQASLNEYIYPNSHTPSYSNYGSVGIIQMPSARLQPVGSLAFSFSDLDPYLRGSVIAYPFSWFEASYQYTDINNALYSNARAFSGDQTFKDKSFDVKFKLLSEKKYTPAIAVGIRDVAGTGIFASEYVVASKKFLNVDFTFGIGWGALSGNKISNPLSKISPRFNKRTVALDTQGGEFNTGYFFSGNAGYFGGAEMLIPNFKGLRFKVELDGTNYDEEGFPDGKDSFTQAFESIRRADSKFNFGFLYPVSNNLHLKLSYAKGNTINLGFSLQAELGSKTPLIQKNDPLKGVNNSAIVKKVNSKEVTYVYNSVLKYLRDEQFFVQNASVKKNSLEVVYTQSKHSSFARATGRVATVLDEISPDYIDEFTISNVNGGLGMHSVTIDREEFSKYKEENLHALSTKNISTKSFNYDREDYIFRPVAKYPASFYKISPSLRSQIGGPDGFYFGDLRLAFHSEVLFSSNLSFSTSASAGITDNFDALKLKSDSVLPHVRTDIVQYLRESRTFAIKRAQLNYFINPLNDIYAKASIGYFEEMFGGLGGEILYRPFQKNYGIGAELWRVKKRDFDQLLKFRRYETTTGHINFYYKHSSTGVIFQVKGGRFLAGDSGLNFDFSRRFKSGLRMGAFFSVTDISKEEFGEGSFDKGFYFHIPIESFFESFSKGNAGFGLRPITRDGAAILVHGFHLWGVTEQAQATNLTRDWDDLYD
jgi:hypothetical protein